MTQRILLLEDQDETRRGLAALLEHTGHTVLRARNALEAEALCIDAKPDVAIIDIELPGLQGNEWALHLKEYSPETRIIFVSGRQGLAGIDRFGPDVQFIHKPIVPDEFLAIVEAGETKVLSEAS